MTEQKSCKNEDVELWREKEGDFYSPSIFKTKSNLIGINVGGFCIARPIREIFNCVVKLMPKPEVSGDYPDAWGKKIDELNKPEPKQEKESNYEEGKSKVFDDCRKQKIGCFDYDEDTCGSVCSGVLDELETLALLEGRRQGREHHNSFCVECFTDHIKQGETRGVAKGYKLGLEKAIQIIKTMHKYKGLKAIDDTPLTAIDRDLLLSEIEAEKAIQEER